MLKSRLFLVVFIIFASFIRAEGEENYEPCERILENFAALLEADGNFKDSNKVDSLPSDQHTFSTCKIPVVTLESGEEIAYLMSRSSDNFTVFVHRAPVASSTLVLYGPFYSAYRK